MKQICALIVLAAAIAGCSKQEAPKRIYTPEEYRKAAQTCVRKADLACAEQNMTQFVQLRPNDSSGHGYLTIIYNWEDKPELAIVQAEKAIEMGEGTYDLFAAYATSLAKVGRTDDAIDWSYRTLKVVPSLVDVRGSLAKLLIQRKRPYEALALLTSFDDELVQKGSRPYFEGQRIAIESTLDPTKSDQSGNAPILRVGKLGDHFYAPVSLGDGYSNAFMVDTGATLTAMDETMLKQLRVHYTVLSDNVPMRTADGRSIVTRKINVETVKVGPFALNNVQIVVCQKCASLLGQNALSKFDLKSSVSQGVEYLTFERR